MRHYSFQFSTGYASAWDQRSVHRQAELDKTTFDRVRSQFKKAASQSCAPVKVMFRKGYLWQFSGGACAACLPIAKSMR
jgi:hypothetical protein